jgi:integrase
VPKPTDTEIRNAKPRAKVYRLAFGGGFCLSVTPEGAKYWQLRYRFAGREKLLSLGVYAPEAFKHVGVKDAIQKATEARALLARGIDPSEARRETKLALRMAVARTFGDAANKWAEHNAPRWRPATREKVDQCLRKDLLPALGRRPLASITPLELGDVVAKIEARKALNVAKKTRQWLGRIFEFAIAKGLTTSNPAEYLGAVAMPEPPAANHAHLAIDELPAFLRALDAYPGSELTKAATSLALWTANRPGVTRTLRWSELDLDASLWTIPKGRDGMKRGYSHVTPLPRRAVALLRKLHAMTGSYEYVFPGRNDPRQPMSDGAVTGMIKTMGYAGRQTAHGFRHLVSTALNERGYKSDWIERQLAHGDPDAIRDTYNKAHYLADRKKMMQAWADYLDEIKAGGAVLPFRKKAGASR